MMSFMPLGVLLVMKTLEDDSTVSQRLVSLLTIFGILYYHMLSVCAIPTYRVYQLHDIVHACAGCHSL